MKTFNKNNTYVIALLIASVAISLSSCNNLSVPENRPIPDAFKQNERLGRGGNLGNILYEFDNWDKEREMNELDMIKEIGLQGVRINTGPFSHVTDKPPYTLSDAFLERLDWTIDQALSRGLTVIIDNHEYHVMADDPMGNHEMFLSRWKQMSERYKDCPDNV